MDDFVEPLPLSRVESGMAGEEAQYLLRFWHQNEGYMQLDSGMNWISRKLMMFLPEHIVDDVPPATMIGKESTFKRYFPETDRPTALPKDYRRSVAHGYHAAIHREPWYDIQRTGLRMGPGTPDLVLERLILPFWSKGGFDRVFCLMTLVEDCAGSRQSDPERHHVHFQPGKVSYQSGWVRPSSNELHLHAAS